MTLATWPLDLPVQPLADRYSETVADTLVRSKVDQGPDKLRRRTTAGVGEITASYLLAAAQTAILSEFYDVTLAGGALAFSMAHPRTGATVTLRFKKPPQITARNGTYYMARLELEVLP